MRLDIVLQCTHTGINTHTHRHEHTLTHTHLLNPNTPYVCHLKIKNKNEQNGGEGGKTFSPHLYFPSIWGFLTIFFIKEKYIYIISTPYLHSAEEEGRSEWRHRLGGRAARLGLEPGGVLYPSLHSSLPRRSLVCVEL